jgi:hypothetical protein
MHATLQDSHVTPFQPSLQLELATNKQSILTMFQLGDIEGPTRMDLESGEQPLPGAFL